MIARIFIPIILFTILSDLYIDRLFRLHLKSYKLWKRLLWFTPCVLIIVCTLLFTLQSDFAPDNPLWLYIYLFACSIIVIPKVVFTICSLIGIILRKVIHSRRNWGNIFAPVFCLAALYIIIYGSVVEANKLVVKRVDIYSKNLPATFNGYRIVQFSDAHVGSIVSLNRSLLVRAVDSINAQHADMVVFTGDIQNKRQSVLYTVIKTLGNIKARDGVYSVLGNHDYCYYIKTDKATALANKRELVSLERQCSWNVLLNQNVIIRRGNDSIVIAGEEDAGKKPFPDYSDLGSTLKGVSPAAYVVMLQHDPAAWQLSILPKSHAQLTLSGHTHGGQVRLAGVRPTMIKYKEDYGLYYSGNRALYVSAGIGGLVPFRFGVPPEIVVITLRKSK